MITFFIWIVIVTLIRPSEMVISIIGAHHGISYMMPAVCGSPFQTQQVQPYPSGFT